MFSGKGAPSPNTGKTLLALRHKQIKHSTVYISYPDIAPFLEKKGVSPAQGDALDKYTLPAIEHRGNLVMGSRQIARYLEQSFPNTPPLYPGSSQALAMMVEEHLIAVRHFGLYRLVYHIILDSLDAAGREYYRRTRTEIFGPDINSVPTKEQADQIWQEVPGRTALLGQLLQENEGPFFQGYTRSYADLVLVASLRARYQWNPQILERLFEIEPAFRKLYEACSDIIPQANT